MKFLFLLFLISRSSLLREAAVSPLACPPPHAQCHHLRLQLELQKVSDLVFQRPRLKEQEENFAVT